MVDDTHSGLRPLTGSGFAGVGVDPVHPDGPLSSTHVRMVGGARGTRGCKTDTRES